MPPPYVASPPVGRQKLPSPATRGKRVGAVTRPPDQEERRRVLPTARLGHRGARPCAVALFADDAVLLALALDADRPPRRTDVVGTDEVGRALVGDELGLERLAHALDLGFELGTHLGRTALERL